jgi:hypothetical protein
MIDTFEEASDRLVLDLDPGGPVELTDLTGSFAALARVYERYHGPSGDLPAPKLYITRLETGSIIAEIVPYVVLLGTGLQAMDSSIVIADFSRRISSAIRAFANPPAAEIEGPTPTKEDAEDIRAFVRPLTGKSGARLGITHARFERHDGQRSTIAVQVLRGRH